MLISKTKLSYYSSEGSVWNIPSSRMLMQNSGKKIAVYIQTDPILALLLLGTCKPQALAHLPYFPKAICSHQRPPSLSRLYPCSVKASKHMDIICGGSQTSGTELRSQSSFLQTFHTC